MLKKYSTYIKESLDDDYWTFKINEHVIVTGIVDDRSFNDVEAIVTSVDKHGQDSTNMNENGECERYEYHGTTYNIKPINGGDTWWCPKYNLRKIGIDPPYMKPAVVKWYKKGKLVKEAKGDNFQLGDEVMYRYVGAGYNGSNQSLDFHKGRIIKIVASKSGEIQEVGVEFYDWYGGHDCSGRGKDNQCYNVSPEELTPLDNGPVRVRWYKKGKLVNESYEDYDYVKGEEVIVNGVIDDRRFDNYLCKVVEVGDRERDSILIKPLENHHDGHGLDEWYVRYQDVSPIEKGPVKVRWYKKGKLQNENKKFIYNKNKSF